MVRGINIIRGEGLKSTTVHFLFRQRPTLLCFSDVFFKATLGCLFLLKKPNTIIPKSIEPSRCWIQLYISPPNHKHTLTHTQSCKKKLFNDITSKLPLCYIDKWTTRSVIIWIMIQFYYYYGLFPITVGVFQNYSLYRLAITAISSRVHPFSGATFPSHQFYSSYHLLDICTVSG